MTKFVGLCRWMVVSIIVFSHAFLFGRDAPITTAVSTTICPGSSFTVPVTVTNFLQVTAISLRMDYNPTLMTYTGYANVNQSLGGILINEVPVSGTLKKIIVVWSNVIPLTLPDGATLFELNFTHLSGSPILMFNNTDGGGGECEYADENAVPMNDLPTSTFYHNAIISNQALPSAGPITGLSSVCKGQAGVSYSITPLAGATSYSWTVPPGATIVSGSSTHNITVNYGTSASSGNVTVAGVNSCGPGASSALFITVNDLPVPTIIGSPTGCAGAPSVLYTTQTGMSDYLWSVSPGGNITAGLGTHEITVTWNVAGSQSVSVNYTNVAGCTAQAATVYPVTVNPLPIPSVSGLNQVCAGTGGVSYTTEPGMINYQWVVSSGGMITAGVGTNLIMVTWNTAGAQQVSITYTHTNGCNPATPTVFPVTVDPLPYGAGAITGTSSVCAGNQQVPYSIAPIPNAISYVWTLPAGAGIASGAGTNAITVNFSAAASSGNITVYGSNLCGNGTPSLPFPVTVYPLPAGAGWITGQERVCEGDSAVTYSVDPVANATNYVWTVPVGAFISSGAGTNAIQVDYPEGALSGSVSVFGVNSCGAGVSSPPMAVIVSPVPPTPVITLENDTLQSNAEEGNQWFLNQTAIPGATFPRYVPVVTGFYRCVVTLEGCSSDSSNSCYVVVTGIRELAITPLSLYPNPSNGMITILHPFPGSDPYEMEISNLLGIRVFYRKDLFFAASGLYNLDLTHLHDGIYHIRLTGKGSNQMNRIILIK